MTDNPLQAEQQALIQQLSSQLSATQLTWLSGYLYGQVAAHQQLLQLLQQPGSPVHNPFAVAPNAGAAPLTPAGQTLAQVPVKSVKLTILFGTHSGNSRKVAVQAKQHAESKGYEVKLVDMNECKPRDLKDEKNLLLIVSTHGEGQPPTAAAELHEFLYSKRAPSLLDTKYSVLALGDKSYIFFCKTGIDFDTRLAELGAQRIANRVDCDTSFEADARQWIEDAVAAFDREYAPDLSSVQVNVAALAGLPSSASAAPASQYSKEKPFEAEILEKIQLNGRGSEKETYHIELSLEGSGLRYQPGDAVGVYPQNPKETVEQLLASTGFSATDTVSVQNKELSIADAFGKRLEITVLNRDVLSKHNQFAQSSKLGEIINDPTQLKAFLYGKDVVDLLREYPVQYTPSQLAGVLRPLPPRLYSISSSLLAHPDEVHLTVGAVRYTRDGRLHRGACSSFLADSDNRVPVFIENNEGFRLPTDGNTPIIMIGPGTGVAPFRAFIEERECTGSRGKNWLFFGDQHLETDFLYQLEWLSYLKTGTLSKLDVAFSRDQADKIYVQHKMLQHSKELYGWLQEGARVYVCGDRNRMAADVQSALTEIVKREAAYNDEQAIEYIKQLKKQHRYQEDVY